ncbi:MAG: DUF1697 domain-containing protein [Bryobacterales bacterium]
MSFHVAFFRGINVGGHHLIKMEALRKLHESLGFEDVQSVLQSGNIVFRAKSATSKQLEEAFEKEFGFRSAVILRSAKDLRAAADAHPFPPDDEHKPNWVAFAFFEEAVPAKARAALDAYDGPEQVAYGKREIFLYFSEGMGRSKLPLKGDCTVRNWNTVAKLLELAS